MIKPSGRRRRFREARQKGVNAAEILGFLNRKTLKKMTIDRFLFE
jgi:hypothetical protein